MNLYLVRHGDAEKSTPGVGENERSLTIKGVNAITVAAEGWKKLVGEVDYILSSPLKRAVQTAEIIAKIIDVKNPVMSDKKLSPGNKTEFLLDAVHEINAENILIVGHQPDLANHLSNLISSPGASFEFKKGSIAKISFGGKVRIGRGTLEFLIPAEAYK